MRRPTVRQLESAEMTLMWLLEDTKSPKLRNDTKSVLKALDEELIGRRVK